MKFNPVVLLVDGVGRLLGSDPDVLPSVVLVGSKNIKRGIARKAPTNKVY